MRSFSSSFRLNEWVCSRALACHTLHIMTGDVARRTGATFVNENRIRKMHVPFNIRLALVCAVIPSITCHWEEDLWNLLLFRLEKVVPEMGTKKLWKSFKMSFKRLLNVNDFSVVASMRRKIGYEKNWTDDQRGAGRIAAERNEKQKNSLFI